LVAVDGDIVSVIEVPLHRDVGVTVDMDTGTPTLIA
jgi:hypothetical protein